MAIYSDADSHAQHVRLADEAYNVGPATSSQSYLNIERIVQAAKEAGVDAVHPGKLCVGLLTFNCFRLWFPV